MATDGRGSATLGPAFAAVAHQRSEHVAVVAGEERIRYADLAARADRLACQLAGHGVSGEAVAAVLVDRSRPEFVVAALALWQAGACYLPVDGTTPAPRLDALLAGTAATAVVDARRADLPLRVLSPRAEAVPHNEVLPDHLAYVLHTSGSTGAPKPVAVTHRAVLDRYRGWAQAYGLDVDPPVTLQGAGPAFDVHVGELIRSLLSGGTLVLCPQWHVLDPPRLAGLIDREAVDSLELTPTVLTVLTDWLLDTGRELPSLRLVAAGGEAWSPEQFRRLRRAIGPRARIVNTYGVCEATVDSTLQDVREDDLAGDGSVPIGQPFPGVTVAVLDDALRPVRDGSIGELYLGGTGLARGYHRDPGATARRFLPAVPEIGGDRMYRTGDLVRRRIDGALVHVGRVDDEVKIRGIRIRLAAVETALLGLPGIAQAAAVVVRRAGETVLIGHVVPAVDQARRTGSWAARLRAELGERVPDALVPAEIVVHERLPVSATGKLDRAALNVPAEPAAGFIPGDDLERAVATAWERVLGRPPRDRSENFFAAGGTSLSAARLAAAVGRETGADIVLAALFGDATVSGIRALVAVSAEAADDADAEPPVIGALAPHQHGLWLLHQLYPDAPTYHLPTVLRLTGTLDVDALGKALDLLVERHDALRTAIVTTSDGPRLDVRTGLRFPLRVCATGDPGDAVDRAVRQPFDLTSPPLARGTLVRWSARTHELVLVVHHLVFDGWSERVLLAELGELYSALVADRPHSLPPPAVDYARFAARQADRLSGARGRAHREYWRHALAALPAPLDLPGGGPGSGRGRAGTCSSELGAGTAKTVRAIASRHRVTPHGVLLAVFAALLHRWSGREDLVVGVPWGYRDRPESQELVGFLVSTLPVRLSVPSTGGFATLLASVHAALGSAGEHGELPFAGIVEDLRAGGRIERGSAFRVWFNWLGELTAPPPMTGLLTTVLPTPVPGALFDLGLYVTEKPDGFELDLVYDVDAIDGRYGPDLLAQYGRLVDALCGDVTRSVRAEPLRVSTVENAPGDLRTSPAPLSAVLRAVADRHASHVAVRHEGGEVGYRELYRDAAALARALRAEGVRPGDVVPIHAVRCANMVTAVLGVLGAGAAFAVLDAGHPPARLADQLRDLGARTGVVLGEGVPAPLRAVLGNWLPVKHHGPTDSWPLPGLTGDGPAYVAFTSGTSGLPAAVRGRSAPLAHFLTWYTERYRIGAADRFALLSGLGHDPLLRDLLTPLWTGATLCVPPPGLLRSPRELLAWLAEERVTVLHATPALCRLLALPGTGTLPGLRLLVCGGDLMRADDLAAIRAYAPNALVLDAYGTTETPQIAGFSEWPPHRRPPEGPLPVGAGAPGFELTVVDALGRRAGVGEAGTIVVRGPYLAGDRIEADPVPGHGRYDTGDLGRYDPDGAVTVLGRADGQVQIRGFRVEPAEVERCLLTHPDVVDAAATSAPGPGGENQLIACVVARQGADPSPGALRAHVRGRLPEHMVPAWVRSLPALPLTLNGKVDRAALSALPAEPPAPFVAPATDLERVIARVWCSLLGVDRVGADRNFFDLGATSLLLIRAHVAIEAELDRVIPIAAFFEHTTVGKLAEHLAAGQRPEKVAADATSRRRVLRHLRLAARAAVPADAPAHGATTSEGDRRER